MTIAFVRTVLTAMVMLSELIACSSGSGLRGPISTGISGVPTSALSKNTDSEVAQMKIAPPEARGASTSTTLGPATIISKAYPSYCLSVGSDFDPKAGAVLQAAHCNDKDSAQLFTFAGQVKPVVRESQMLHYATDAVWIPYSADGRRRSNPRGVKVVEHYSPPGSGIYWEVDEHARIIDPNKYCLSMLKPPTVTREACALGEPSQQWEGLTCEVGKFTIRGYWEALVYIHGQNQTWTTTWGSQRTSTQTNIQQWSQEVTTEVSAGFEVEGIGASVSVSGSISESLGQEYQQAFAMSTSQQVEIGLPIAGQWWRWAFETTDLCGSTTTTVAGEVAVTHSADEQPCCVPGGFVNASDPFGKQCLEGAHMPQGTPGCSSV